MRVVDLDGAEVPQGEAGEIQIRGHNVMKGYWNLPDATKATITPDGWLATGDVGRVDEDGYFYIVDRTKDMIIRGGYNVYPREIEEVLYEHPAVAEAAVIGIPHDSLGEEVGRRGRAQGRRCGDPGRAARVRQGPGGRLQVSAPGVARRRAAQGTHRQGPEARHHCPDNRKHAITMASPITKPDELAAPLDLLLTSATKPFVSRMMPDATWARLGASLAQRPGAVAGRAATLTRELGGIAAGKSHRAPARADKRFSDTAWQENPLLHRIMQAYLAAAEAAEGLLADAELDWRDNEKMRFVVDNVVEGLAPSNNPLISPLGWKALIDTGGLSAVRGVKAFARDMLSKPRVPAMVEPDAFAVGETVAATKGAVVLQTSMFELIQYAPQTAEGARDSVAHGAAGDQQVLHHGHRAGAQHDRVLRPAGSAGLRHFVAQSASAPSGLGFRRVRRRDRRGDGRGAEDRRDRQRPPAGHLLGRHPRGDDRGPPRRDRRGRPDRRPLARGHRAGRDPGRFHRRGR